MSGRLLIDGKEMKSVRGVSIDCQGGELVEVPKPWMDIQILAGWYWCPKPREEYGDCWNIPYREDYDPIKVARFLVEQRFGDWRLRLKDLHEDIGELMDLPEGDWYKEKK